MNCQPSGFWAKFVRGDDGSCEWCSVCAHSADVAACHEALLAGTLLRPRLARLGGLEDLSPIQVARLNVLAALHDVGKCNLGFQNKSLTAPPFTAGHCREVVHLLFSRRGYEESRRLCEVLRVAQLATWGEAMDALLLATFSHHGRPIAAEGVVDLRLWQTVAGRDPFAGIAEVVDATHRWFPEAWTPASDVLPARPAFQHAWAGLLMLADWIASDRRFFPFPQPGDGERMPFSRRSAKRAVVALGLDPEGARGSRPDGALGYQQVWGTGFVPRPAQTAMLGVEPSPRGSVTVLEAATGSGKTEAALLHYLRFFLAGFVDGLYFALPTRTAATQIYERVCRAVAAAFPDDDRRRPPVVLAVPGYLSADGVTGEALPSFEVLWPEEERERLRYRGWAAENRKRYLAGAVVVGTVDQVLLSALAVPHAHLRATALLRLLLVVDEVHASDVYMTRVLEAVLDQHLACGGHALLMSATLGSSARRRLTAEPGERVAAGKSGPGLEQASTAHYPAITVATPGAAPRVLEVEAGEDGKRVDVHVSAIQESAAAIAALAFDAACRGARVLVIRNTVAGCLEVQEEIEKAASGGPHGLLFRCRGVAAPHHSRFARTDRRLLDQAIEAGFGRERPAGGCVAVATQTVEQSLDLDADLLLADLAPMDVLLQRVGRLHRHARASRPAGFETACVRVLVPADRDLGSHIRTRGQASGPHGLGTVYEDLRVLEATWRLLEENPHLAIPRDNRMLVEGATHPAALAAVVADLGDSWVRHSEHLLGGATAERRLADLNRLRRDRGFFDGVLFPEGTERRRIPTRLGEEDRRVLFKEPFKGPFDEPVEELTLPAHLVAEATPADAAEAEEVRREGSAIHFRFGPRAYLYDRWGLRPLEKDD